MANWKRAVVFGSFGAAAFFLITGKRPVGIVLAGVGVAVLAAEYPERFRQAWDRAPEFLERGNQLVTGVSRALDRLAEYNTQRHAGRSREYYA